jgi:hypothetical protein
MDQIDKAIHLRQLAGLDRGQLIRRYPRRLDDLAVDHPHAVLPDRAHPQLGLVRHPELADHDHIQRRPQRPGHLQRNRHTAPRQAEHNHRLAPQVLQPGGQQPPRIGTISEQGDTFHWRGLRGLTDTARDLGHHWQHLW